jgi:hypothetical protein
MASSSIKDIPLPTGLTSLAARRRLEERMAVWRNWFLKD